MLPVKVIWLMKARIHGAGGVHYPMLSPVHNNWDLQFQDWIVELVTPTSLFPVVQGLLPLLPTIFSPAAGSESQPNEHLGDLSLLAGYRRGTIPDHKQEVS